MIVLFDLRRPIQVNEPTEIGISVRKFLKDWWIHHFQKRTTIEPKARRTPTTFHIV